MKYFVSWHGDRFSECLHLLSQAIRLAFLIAIFCAIPSARCSGGDDFSNNLFSDLSPLLALFGDQVTKQYLSNSMGWADHALFAMVPLGILTAIISAIRCGGPRWLKAIVGRAKESRAIVEVELMSSTSTDVCELWNGHDLVRTIGKPSIMQLFYWKDLPSARCRGVYLLEEMKRSGHTLMIPDQPLENPGSVGYYLQPTTSEIELQKLEEEEDGPLLGPTDTRDNYEPDDENQLRLSSTEFPPNISLNTHGNGISPWEMWFWAVFGIILQLSLLVFAGLLSLYKGWGRTFYRGDPKAPIPSWIVVPGTLGTVILMAGMILCCYLIDKSSKEERWEFWTDTKPKIVWLQKGGTVGDQHFNSYAIFAREPKADSIFKRFFARALLREFNLKFVTSHRDLNIDNPPAGFSLVVVIATCMSLSGFIIQFAALRNLHWSFPVTQLGCTLLMTAIGAWVRRFLFSETEAKEIEMGHELDFLAREIGGCSPWSIDWTPLKDGGSGASGNTQTASDIKYQSTVDRVFRTRKRLGALSPWESHLRSTTLSLCKAIESVMKALHESDHIILKDTTNLNIFTWNIKISTGASQKPNDPVAEISLHLKRSRPVDNSLAPWGDWMVDQHALEALLSLLLEDRVIRSKPSLVCSDIHLRRLCFNSQNSWERQIFKWWIDHRDLNIKGWPNLGTLSPSGIMSVGYTEFSTLCAQEVFASFFSEVSKQLIERIEGPVKLRLTEKTGLHAFGLRCDVITSLVDTVKDSGLGTEGEAFLAIIDPLALHGKLPEPKLAIPDICQQLQDSTLPNLADAEGFLHHLLKAQVSIYLGSGEPDWESAVLFLQEHLQALTAKPTPKATLISQFAWMLRTVLHQACIGESPQILKLRDNAYKIESYKNGLPTDWPNISKTLIKIFQSNAPNNIIEPRQRSMLRDGTSTSPEDQWVKTLEDLEEAVDAGYNEVVDFILTRRCTHVFTLVDLKNLENAFKKAVEKAEPRMINIFITHLHILAATNSPHLDTVKAEPPICELASNGFDSAKRLLESSDIHLCYNTLQRAAWNGDLNIVQLLLDKGAAVNAPAANADEHRELLKAAFSGKPDTIRLILERNINGLTALQTASGRGHLEIVKLLLAAGADSGINTSAIDVYGRQAFEKATFSSHLYAAQLILAANVNGVTALQAAAGGGHLEVAQLLIDKGANINTVISQYGRTAFQAAAEGGNLEVVQFLLDKGARINTRAAKFHGRTALQAAAGNGHLEVVKLLLGKGNDVNAPARRSSGRTALQAAAEGGHLDVVKLLLVRGAEINAPEVTFRGRNALQAAAGGGHSSVVQFLLEKGADINASPASSFGRTAIQAAAEGGHLDVIKLLLANHADINQLAGTVDGRTALQAAAESGHMEAVLLLLQSGAHLHAPGGEFSGYNALQAAAAGGHLEIAKLLLSNGADVNAPAHMPGETALEAASTYGHLEMVRFLLEQGADINAQATRHTAPRAAAAGGHLEVAELLLEKGANINAPASKIGDTALQIAAQNNRIEMVELLLAKGVDVNAPPAPGFNWLTAIWRATNTGNWEIVDMLRLAGAKEN